MNKISIKLNKFYKKHEKKLAIILLIGILFLTGCTDPDPTTKEFYAVGRVLHNINDSTLTLLSNNVQDYGIYKFSYGFPGDSPEYYRSTWWFVSPAQYIAASANLPV